MFKHVYILIILLGLATSFAGCGPKRMMPDLKETFSAKDFRPFGTYVFYRLISNIYAHDYIYNSKKPFDKFYEDTHIDSASLYISVSKQLYMSEEEADALSSFVYDGNTAFISSSHIDTILLSKFSTRQENNQWLDVISSTQFSNTSVRLSAPVDSANWYSYYYRQFINYFPVVNSIIGRSIGFNEMGQTNMAVISWGRGKLFLHCEPRAFSNYFLLTGNNSGYVKDVMQWINEQPGNVFWDDYYNRINSGKNSGNSFSSISTILQYPALAMAFWIALLLLMFYIVFEGKRRQRIVPVIKQVENSSIEFTEAVAGLYLTQKSNKNIAEKMITYFNEFIRTNYFLNVHTTNKAFLTSLSKKSGVPGQQVDELFYSIQQTLDTEELTDEALLDLNIQIEQFYKMKS